MTPPADPGAAGGAAERDAAKIQATAVSGKSRIQPPASGTPIRFRRWRRNAPVPRLATRNDAKNPATAKNAGIRKVWMRLTSQPNQTLACRSW